MKNKVYAGAVRPATRPQDTTKTNACRRWTKPVAAGDRTSKKSAHRNRAGDFRWESKMPRSACQVPELAGNGLKYTASAAVWRIRLEGAVWRRWQAAPPTRQDAASWFKAVGQSNAQLRGNYSCRCRQHQPAGRRKLLCCAIWRSNFPHT